MHHGCMSQCRQFRLKFCICIATHTPYCTCKTKLPAHACSIAVCSCKRTLELLVSYFKFAIMHGVRSGVHAFMGIRHGV